VATHALPVGAATEPETAVPELPLVAVLPRLGLVAYGRGGQEVHCNGGCARFATSGSEYEHRPATFVGVDALVRILPFLRAGPSLGYTFTNSVDVAGAGAFEVGKDLVLDATVEAAIRVTPRFWIAPRIQAGALVLYPTGELQGYLSALHEEFCPVLPGECPIGVGSHVGVNGAVGVGAIVGIRRDVRLRADIFAQYYSLRLYTVKASLANQAIEVYETLSGARLFVTAGVEFF
jgi:hypothetical protein